MAFDSMNSSQPQRGIGSAENIDGDRKEQFNELSELSLEERMNVADHIGIPVEGVGEAAALGTASAGGDAESSDLTEDENTVDETDR